MAKPSIFSREYEKRMRKRKIRITLLISFLVVVGIFYFAGGNFKDIVKSKINLDKSFNFSFSNRDNKKDITSEDKTATNTENNNPAPQNKIEEKSYDITLGNGSNIKAVYESAGGVNKFKYINTSDTAITFNVNPSGTGMVLYDSKSQSMWFLDINGKLQDISDLSYKSYKRETILARRPGYVWCASPKFIDDENIGYFSQLPYIGKSTKKYLWTVNIKNKDRHIYKSSISGENIKFGNNTEKGLEVIMDDGSIRFVSISNKAIVVTK